MSSCLWTEVSLGGFTPGTRPLQPSLIHEGTINALVQLSYCLIHRNITFISASYLPYDDDDDDDSWDNIILKRNKRTLILRGDTHTDLWEPLMTRLSETPLVYKHYRSLPAHTLLHPCGRCRTWSVCAAAAEQKGHRQQTGSFLQLLWWRLMLQWQISQKKLYRLQWGLITRNKLFCWKTLSKCQSTAESISWMLNRRRWWIHSRLLFKLRYLNSATNYKATQRQHLEMWNYVRNTQRWCDLKYRTGLVNRTCLQVTGVLDGTKITFHI